MPSVDPVPLSASEIDAAAEVLIQSFASDPGLLFVLPDPAERQHLSPMLARTMLRFAMRCGAPLVTAGPVKGVALWFHPDAAEPSGEDLLETGIAGVPEQIGPEPWLRFKRLLDQLDALHPRYAPEPHWYLAMLGVHPDAQRQGIGDALMQPAFRAADRDGVACYLEAPTLENAQYYERRGFQLMAETDIPDSNVHIWMMRRDPVR